MQALAICLAACRSPPCGGFICHTICLARHLPTRKGTVVAAAATVCRALRFNAISSATVGWEWRLECWCPLPVPVPLYFPPNAPTRSGRMGQGVAGVQSNSRRHPPRHRGWGALRPPSWERTAPHLRWQAPPRAAGRALRPSHRGIDIGQGVGQHSSAEMIARGVRRRKSRRIRAPKHV